MRNLKVLTPFLILSFLIESCNSNDSTEEIKPLEKKKEILEQELNYVPSVYDIQFPSQDSLKISAKIYEIDRSSPVILLCHQARYNLHEYDEIAPKLNELGFNCVAIDQRSGGELNGFENTTFFQAQKMGFPTDYLDAEKDIISAIKFSSDLFQQDIVLWGSSYSATLALYQASEIENVKAVISFSPGNYFSSEKGSLIDILKEVNKPIWITSSLKEHEEVSSLLKNKLKNQVVFKPSTSGLHGSKALWNNHDGRGEYWNSLILFLNQNCK